MKPEEIYNRALALCIDAYKADLTPASWRAPAELVPAMRCVKDPAGCYVSLPVAAGGAGWTFMGLPVEVVRGKPEAVLTLISEDPGGPEVQPWNG